MSTKCSSAKLDGTLEMQQKSIFAVLSRLKQTSGLPYIDDIRLVFQQRFSRELLQVSAESVILLHCLKTKPEDSAQDDKEIGQRDYRNRISHESSYKERARGEQIIYHLLAVVVASRVRVCKPSL